jgi:catechol 2,3-dioxygenase-like lactoylglutathione lyase family enzyme
MKQILGIQFIATGMILAMGIGPTAFGGSGMQLKRVTTVVFTDDVDGCTAFYTDRLDFELTMAVPAQEPEDIGSQFAAVTNGRHELMFQTFASAEKDAPGAVARSNPPSFMLYVEVPDLDAAIERMQGLEPAISRRQTFYGSEEIAYRDPCGTVVVLAEFPEATTEEPANAADE